MANTKITDLPSASAVGTSVVPVTNAAGNATNKVTLADIAALAPLSDVTPQPAGTASAGEATSAARADHVHSVSYASLTNVPETFAPSQHSHAVGDVTNLQTSLDGKASLSHTHTASNITDFASAIPVASASVSGTVKVGSGLAITAGVLSASDGRWSLFLPPAPTNVSGTAGNSGQVLLTWTAPAVLAQTPITDYIIQYSSNAGGTWTTHSDGMSTSTSAKVTGLTDDTAYVFRVAGVNGAGQGAWSAASASVTPINQIIVEYLVVGGGGCGGHYFGGGGGGGGFTSGTLTNPTAGSPYSITVGAGGATLGSASGGPMGADGNSSAFASFSAGGGQGGAGINSQRNGWSGGGNSGSPPSNSGGFGTQVVSTGGGGGAGGAGAGSGAKPNGGAGAAFYGVLYAGGGGGGAGIGSAVAGDGRAGGGGGQSTTAGDAGTASTGGGGGGGGGADNSNVGGAGGSGVVILRSPVAAASTTGSPAVTTVGGDVIYTFTGSGSITF